MGKALSVFSCVMLLWLCNHGAPLLLELFPEEETGHYDFIGLPDDWAARLENLREQGHDIHCRATAARMAPEAGIGLDCVYRHSDAGPSTYVVLSKAFETPFGGTDFVVMSRKLTPWPRLNVLSGHWLPALFLLLLLWRYPWREDAGNAAAYARQHPLALLGSGLLINAIPRLIDWAQTGTPFHRAPDISWLSLELVVTGPVLEELLFRGVMVRWLEKAGLGTQGIALVTSLLFSAWHGWSGNLGIMAWYFLAGLILFHVRHRSDSILAAILVHMIANAPLLLF